ncbi:hypothetical protein AB1395_03560 [Streptococcus pluranimalium]|uniref:hypothetical protein n=1 Tax=Streptococcus pluranimalium TaxID=82348 RepID=UPI00346748C8
MKKIRSCQLLKTVCLVILGGLLVMGLAGCDVRKNSRAYLEGKAAELERVFPTENLEDLFEEFPGGFKFGSLYHIKSENGYSYSQVMDITGSSKMKKIEGTVTNLKNTAEPRYKREVLKESHFEYKNGHFIFENPEFSEEDLVTEGFLMQYFEINKEKLAKLDVISKSYSWETEDGTVTYQLLDKGLNNFLKVNGNKEVDMFIDIDYETIHQNEFSYALTFRYGKEVKYTLGFAGYDKAGDKDEK